MKNIKISILCAMFLTTSIAKAEIFTSILALTILTRQALDLFGPETQASRMHANHSMECLIKDKKILEMEEEFKQCLKSNLRNTNKEFLEIPSKCVEQAKAFIIEAGKDRADEIITNFKTAEDMKILTMEKDFKLCLRTNINSTNLESLEIPTECIELARTFIMEAGRDKAAEIISDFKAARA